MIFTPISEFINTPVLSLQTGTTLAHVDEAIVDPRSLSVMAFSLRGNRLSQKHGAYLLVRDIREVSSIGHIIDSNDELVEADDIIELQTVLNFSFELLGISVKTESDQQLGTVTSYAVDPSSLLVQQISVEPPFWQRFTEAQKIIRRSQIAAVTNDTITVHDAYAQSPQHRATTRIMPVPIVNNPFRQRNNQPNSDA